MVCLQLFKDLSSSTCYLEAKKEIQKSKHLFYLNPLHNVSLSFISASLCLQNI